jgi:VCBS repeat-containing protein
MYSRLFHHMTDFAPGPERKGPLGKIPRLDPILPFLIFCLILLLSSCSSSGKSSGPSTGSISFTLRVPHNNLSSAQLVTAEDTTAPISCTEWLIAKVEAQTFDENNTLLTQGGPWDCAVGQGTLSGVKPGTNRSVIVNLKNASGTVVLSGKRTNITVIAGQTADLGVIEVSRSDQELPPIAANDSVSVSQGGSTTGNVLTNDTDPEGVGMTVSTTPVTPPGHGTLTLNADGTFSYTNDGTNNTSDSFVYRVTDLYGGTATATVNITIISNWIKSFSAGSGGAASVVQTSDGGYVIAGSTTVAATGYTGVSLIKTDAFGTMVWNKTFRGTTSNDGAASVQQTSDGGYIVAGYTTPISLNAATYRAVLMIKTDANGDLDTSFSVDGQTTIGGATNNDYAYCVRQTSDGGYVIAGKTYLSGYYDAWLIKTLANGTLDTSFGAGGMKQFASASPGSACAYSVQQISGGYIIAGSTIVSTSTQAWLIKTDAAGAMSWNKTFSSTGASGSIAYSVRQTTDSGYIMAGESLKSSGGNDALLIKTDANGNLDTAFGTGGIRTFVGSGTGDGIYVQANSIQQISDGGYVIAGNTGSDYLTPWLVKTDASGTAVWERTYHGSGSTPSDSFSSALQTTDGGYIICGATAGYTAALLIKTDTDGNPMATLTPGLTPGP